jgi:chaperonin GroEL
LQPKTPRISVKSIAMVHRPSIDPLLAFVLMPFKQPFQDYYEDIIKPAAKAAGLDTRKADEIYGTGPIIHDIWRHIWNATVIIADVTGRNPNVNYELGICHALGVPAVIVTQSIGDVPFDYQHRRCIEYKTDGSVWQRKLKKSITATLKKVLAGEDVSPELPWPYDTSPFRDKEKRGPLVPAADARASVLRGARMVRDAVAGAFGPGGTSVSVRVGDRHEFYKEGTAIANSVRSPVPLEQSGIDHARRLANEMRDSVGDGSKTALLLFQKMADSGNTAIKRNHPLSDVLRGMERGTEAVVSAIRSQGKPVTTESMPNVARSAAHGDAGIAKLMAEAYKKAGSDGVVVIRQTNLTETALEIQEGMVFDRGYLDTALLSSGETHECKLEDPYILIYGFKISSMKDLLPLLEQVASTKRPLLIIADDVEGEALATMVVNRKQGNLDSIAVRAPGYGDRRKALLEDIAILTGGTAITGASGRSLASLRLQDLGRARNVLVTKETTTIAGGAGEPSVAKHVNAIREEILRTADPFAIEKLRERMAKLRGAIASIRIGGISSQEVIDNAYYASSAMHSTQRAIEEGAVAGGGACLFYAKTSLATLSLKRAGEAAGVTVISEALEEPIRQLVLNSKAADPAEVLGKIGRSKRKGFNSETRSVENMVQLGILDPVATVTRAVQLASAHARTLLAAGMWDSGGPKAQEVPGTVQGEQAGPPDKN